MQHVTPAEQASKLCLQEIPAIYAFNNAALYAPTPCLSQLNQATYLGHVHAFLAVYARALDAQQHSKVEGGPVRLWGAAVAAHAVAWHAAKHIQGAVG